MNKFLAIICFGIIIASCTEEVSFYPKPRGELRMTFPERVYSNYNDKCPYEFEIPQYFNVLKTDTTSCNRNIDLGQFNGTIFLTYLPVDSNLMMNIEYSRKLAYEHAQIADEIRESAFINPEQKAYGLSYDIVGNAASPFQFYVTDSSEHFLRGALYFNTAPNYDSIKPTLDYVKADILHLIETTTWK